jgi:hypothetical protein
MRDFIWLLAVLAVLGACGAIKDPDKEKINEDVRTVPGSVKTGVVELRTPDSAYDDFDDDDDGDYETWMDDVDVDRLPKGFDYKTLAVDDDDDGLVLRYALKVASWVRPGTYRFHVHYEFWPTYGLVRDEYRIQFVVHVRPAEDREVESRAMHLEVRQPLPQAEGPMTIWTEFDVVR